MEAVPMTLHSVTHVALRVQGIRDAEAFYIALFALAVAFRETETPDGWRTIPLEATWDEIDRAGVGVGLAMLHRGGLRLALEATDETSQTGLLSHIGVQVEEQELQRLRERALATGCDLVLDQPGRALIIDDPFGVRWELNTFTYDDPPSLSTGARTGGWLKMTMGGATSR
jgi:hypothetical protein